MTEPGFHQAFEQAKEHHRAGRFRDAERMYRHIIAQHPGFGGAKHQLGRLAWLGGRREIAESLIRQSIWLQPDNAEAHKDLGDMLAEREEFDASVASYKNALAIKPDYHEALSSMGVALGRQGKLDEAISAFRQAISLKPDNAWSHSNLGNVLLRRGMVDDAIAAQRQAIAINPDFPQAMCNLGNALKEKQLPDEAIALYREAASKMPNSAPVHVSLGSALSDRGDLDEAIAILKRAISLDPKSSTAHHNLGNALKRSGQLEQAIAAYRQAIAISPDLAESHRNLGNTLLLRGDFTSSWEEYEWRWRRRYFPSSRRNVTQPVWDGKPLQGRTILLHEEQGFGDVLQFVRYVPLVRERGGKVIIECPASLVKLLLASFGSGPHDCVVIANGNPMPAFDVHCPLQGLPRRFATVEQTIPRDVPYLHADDGEVQMWKARLASFAPNLKVGLCWSANPGHDTLNQRSMTLRALAPLAETAGICFFSLQQGIGSEQTANPPAGMHLTDWTNELKNFNDAGLIANLDLVITIDTATAHLAGAMGRPVWTMLPFVPDWRWQMERDDSPWYTTMRLFRQRSPGEWGSVVDEVKRSLLELTMRRAEI